MILSIVPQPREAITAEFVLVCSNSSTFLIGDPMDFAILSASDTITAVESSRCELTRTAAGTDIVLTKRRRPRPHPN
jgi:hypothetical protein